MRKYDLEHMHVVQYTIYCVVNFTVVCDSAHTVLFPLHALAHTCTLRSLLFVGTNFTEFEKIAQL